MSRRGPFNPARLVLARKRRKMTAVALAAEAGLTSVHLSRLEKGRSEPMADTVEALAKALGYPEEFFFLPDVSGVLGDAVSFRSLKSASVREREAARAAGELGVDVAHWLDQNFALPEPDLPDLTFMSEPEAAARALRQEWGLGERPIASMVALLEAKGVRVFSLGEDTRAIDAFSFWQDGAPYVFLNRMKTAERDSQDAAHELGHLILHRGGHIPRGRDAEREANEFGASFLMPQEDVRARMGRGPSIGRILRTKARWRVSAMALAHRCRQLDLLTDWTYRSVCIELSQQGFRSGEPGGVERDTSRVWGQVFSQLWKERRTRTHISHEIGLPEDELLRLTFDLTPTEPRPESQPQGEGRTEVRIVGPRAPVRTNIWIRLLVQKNRHRGAGYAARQAHRKRPFTVRTSQCSGLRCPPTFQIDRLNRRDVLFKDDVIDIVLKSNKYSNFLSPFLHPRVTARLPRQDFDAPSFVMHPFKISVKTDAIEVSGPIARQENCRSWFIGIRHCSKHVDLKSLVDRLLFPRICSSFKEFGNDACRFF